MIGRIYAIRSPNTDKFYIGSTTQTINSRWSKHKYSFKRDPDRNRYSCFKVMQAGDSYIVLLEECEVKDSNELRKREGNYIKKYKDLVVNRCVAGQTKQEYLRVNRARILASKRSYYNRNKHRINKNNRAYYYKMKSQLKPFKCMCGSVFNSQYLTRHLGTRKHRVFMKKVPSS